MLPYREWSEQDWYEYRLRWLYAEDNIIVAIERGNNG